MPIRFRNLLLAASILVLAACDTAEERAEKHFQSGLELLEANDVPRAILEFRNALVLNESHREARITYARTARANGNIPEAYTNYLFIAEASPENAEARLALSEMAILAANWEEAERHAKELSALETDIERREIVELAMNFRDALLADNLPQVRDLTRKAEQLSETFPNNEILLRILIEGYLRDNRVDDAIAVAALILESEPDGQQFYQIMADLLVAKGDMEGLEAHFRTMLARFPDDTETKSNLIRLLISEGRGTQAEDFLREEIAASEDKVEAHVNLIALIRQLRGDAAALDEIEAALTAHENAPLLIALKAGLMFDRGERDTAISLMHGITENAEPSGEVDKFKVTLAKMLVATGNEIGARQLVEAVLARDAGQIEALKMQADWQISADETDEAIASLRLALDASPDDAEAMTLMARAHERNGDAQLARDLLALAVEASGNAPAESLRFARVQMGQERFSSAEEVLIKALRRVPGEPNLLVALGELYVATSDWSRAEQVANTLRQLDDGRADLAADELQLQIISNREGRDQGLGFLEQLVQESSDATTAKVALIQARLQDNKGEAALALAEELVAEFPDEPAVAMVLGNTQLALADFEAAEATFRAVRATDPGSSVAVLQLLRTLNAQDRTAEAAALVDTALADQPDNPDLLWARASFLEAENDIDGAIEIYERLYAMNSDNQVVANNLASLLVTYRTDEASLERAITVGKRLRDATFPPFQDTYGWLLHRQGRYTEALSYLEPAAEALANDPIVQVHLAKTYLALGRNADALAQFETAVGIADDSDQRQQLADARIEIERLTTVTE